jgi:hypothetical protein
VARATFRRVRSCTRWRWLALGRRVAARCRVGVAGQRILQCRKITPYPPAQTTGISVQPEIIDRRPCQSQQTASMMQEVVARAAVELEPCAVLPRDHTAAVVLDLVQPLRAEGGRGAFVGRHRATNLAAGSWYPISDFAWGIRVMPSSVTNGTGWGALGLER